MASPAKLRTRITRQSGAVPTNCPGYIHSDEERALQAVAANEARIRTEENYRIDRQVRSVGTHVTHQPRIGLLGQAFRRK